MAKNFSDASNLFEGVFADALPTPFESSVIEGCIEKGKSREEGGAIFNFKQFVGAGATDAGDALTAIRKLVFEDKKVTMKDLCDALANNFEGHEALQKQLCDAPKFGNDDDYADEQAAWVSHIFAREVARQPNTRGGFSIPLGAPLQYYLFGGWVVGALPSGRSAWQPLSDAWSPSAGCDTSGPTAVLASMGKIDNAELTGGVTLNLRFDPGFFKLKDGIRRFTHFIRSFADYGIFQVQFNIIDAATLREAQKNPDQYRDLVVKVAGYSAYYTRLLKPLQDGIIARTEHQL
jgi:formate C-acetyltransferase